MVSYLVGGLTSLLIGEEEDDPSKLKDVVMIAVYESPHKQLGVSVNAKPWEVRDAFRSNCVRLLAQTYFNKLDKPVLPYKYSLVAFHLISKTLAVSRAQDLKRYLDEEPTLFQGQARDILQVLRPVHCEGIPMNPAVRACAMLSVIYVDAWLSGPEGGDVVTPHEKYVLRVFYCGRSHVVRRRYSEFYSLNERMSDELLMVPGFPPKDTFFLVFGNKEARGKALCAYANRVHASLAARGVFSPRLMDFLAIDVSRVHIEEDGRISKFLDSTGALQGSAWHMVEETWLKRWRKFVLGRGARRYEPPGPITNELLLIPRDQFATEELGGTDSPAAAAALVDQRATTVPIPRRRVAKQFAPSSREIKALGERDNRHVYLPPPDHLERHQQGETKDPVTIARHYRAVNYNLWVYWKMVHGGGPCISRKNKDILSAPACGSGMEAVSRIQRFGRMVLAKNDRFDRYWKHLSRTAPGVREVLLEFEEKRRQDLAERQIKNSKSERTKSRLRDAARYTQRAWRAKKQYAFNDDNVRVQKHAQEVFATADGEVEHAAPGAPFVVEEGESVVKLGGVERFDVKFTDTDGPTLPLILKKHSCSELTFVQSIDDKWRRDNPGKSRDQLCPDCVLLVVQNYPVSSLTHKQVMGRLESAKWPLTLRFERPLRPDDVKSFRDVCLLDDNKNVDDDFKLQLIKRLLHMGIPLVKYGRKGRPHHTKLYLNETIVFWQIKGAERLREETQSLSLKYDLTHSLALYDLKYVRIDKVSSVFHLPLNRNAQPDRSFTLFAEGRTLDFEVQDVDGDVTALPPVGRRLLAWAFDAIIKEARGSKIFVDKTGAPIRRTQPKKRLRMVR
ncbi:hypothetical protein CTAYLR_001064 [Chrysophaeum taylorii]|uniref:DUSP domain-containing protein n=1 Tax=Chrysophaeum taylorii TaxID=2483200 RepID=A0AAD7XMV7_9STRA|nr:hypothetical protein CTAYLR_001064 [Chrysophaeum taylorii]